MLALVTNLVTQLKKLLIVCSMAALLLLPTAIAHTTTGSHNVGKLWWSGSTSSITDLSSSTSDSVIRSGGSAGLTAPYDSKDGPTYRPSAYISGDNNQRWEGRVTYTLDGVAHTPAYLYTNWNTNDFDSGTRTSTKFSAGTYTISLQISNNVLYEQRLSGGVWGNTGTSTVVSSKSASATILVV